MPQYSYKAKEALEDFQHGESVETDDISDSFLIEDEDGELIVDEIEDSYDFDDEYEDDNI